MPHKNNFRRKLHEVIFGTATPAGKLFDIILLVIIIISVLVVALESVSYYQQRFGTFFFYLEWTFTIFFSIEYVLRLIALKRPQKYVFSFYGIIDFMSTIPMYISVLIPGSHSLMVIRALRLLRIFRILKAAKFLKSSLQIRDALIASRSKILVFLYFVMVMVTITGTLMYFVEVDENSGFTSIPRSIYWAIVTITTVGYGDISPQTDFGQFLAAILMIMGYAVIAVPTGIISVEMSQSREANMIYDINCSNCGADGLEHNSNFCKNCGVSLKDK